MEQLELSIGDLVYVRDEIYNARTKWYDIGLHLRIPVDDLDAIRRDPTLMVGDPLCEVLKHWLKTAVEPKPTWSALIEALRSRTVREDALASELEKKYCPAADCPPLQTQLESQGTQ